MKLISNNVIERFKRGKRVGSINNTSEGLKVQKLQTLLNSLGKGKYNLKIDGYWGKNTQAAYDDFMNNHSGLLTESYKKLFGGREFKSAQKSNQNPTQNFNNFSKKSHKQNVATIIKQQALWNSGAYKNVIDKKTGKPVIYEKAVDGIEGPMTVQAFNNSKNIERNTAPRESRASIFSDIISLFRNNYTPSKETNLKAVMEHKVKTGVTEPYFYVSPKEGKLYRIQGDQILYETPVATGVNFDSDGDAPLPKDENGNGIYDRSLALSATPAGVFTLAKPKEHKYHNEPMFNLVRPAKNIFFKPDTIGAAIHAPATPDRQKQLMNGNKRLTYGCVQLPNGKMSCLYNRKQINEGDSVYIEPTVEGNYLYEDNDGHIKTYFKETPKQVSGKVWGKEFNRNDVVYNTGY